jgi:hypothetical protein
MVVMVMMMMMMMMMMAGRAACCNPKLPWREAAVISLFAYSSDSEEKAFEIHSIL